MHIVLVEDDAQLGDAIRIALEHQSYAVTWLRNGREATLALRDQTADLVLLDLGLPDKDGLEVLAEARRMGIKTPVLVATGTRDQIAGPAAELAALIPGAEAFAIPDRDHMLAVGDRTFKTRVLEFLAERP